MTVQLAKKSIVVATMLGRVLLLEGFQMADKTLNMHRMCLENEHLTNRTANSPWRDGDNIYAVRRFDRTVSPRVETIEKR